jgi:hypothetical protein
VGSVRGKSLRHQYAAHSMHAQHDSRKTTKAGRKANSARFERQVDREGKLPPAERKHRAAHAERAYMLGLAYRSVKVRAARKADAPWRGNAPSRGALPKYFPSA